MPKINAEDGEREFQVSIITSETGSCRVKVVERGTQNKGEASTPLTGELGMREALILAGGFVRKFYSRDKRKAEAEERARKLAEKRAAREAEKRRADPPPISTEVVGELPEADPTTTEQIERYAHGDDYPVVDAGEPPWEPSPENNVVSTRRMRKKKEGAHA